jgi:hypothetical protein
MTSLNLFEGGNIWPDTSDYEQTPEMVDALVSTTEEYLKELGLELPADIVKIETDSNNGKIQFETITKNLQQAEKLI